MLSRGGGVPGLRPRGSLCRHRPRTLWAGSIALAAVVLFSGAAAPPLSAFPTHGTVFAAPSTGSHAAERTLGVADGPGVPLRSTSSLGPSPMPALPPTVGSTLVLSNNTLVHGNFLPFNVLSPRGLVDAPTLHEIFGVGERNNVTFAFDTLSGKVVGVAGVGSDPKSALFVPAWQRLYVADFNFGNGPSNLSVLNSTSFLSLTSVSVTGGPYGLAYDANRSNVLVTEYNANTVAAVSSSNVVLTTVPVGGNPEGIAFDPTNSEVYVANQATGNLTVLNGSTLKSVTSISVPCPSAIALNPTNGHLFVSESCTSGVAEVDPSTNTVATTFLTGLYPGAIAFDPVHLWLYASYSGLKVGGVSVVNVSSGSTVATLAASPGAHGLVLDTLTQSVLLSNAATDNVSAIGGPSPHYSSTVQIGADPGAFAAQAGTGVLLAADGDSGLVSAISPTSFRATRTYSGTFAPDGAGAYDTFSGAAIFANGAGTNGTWLDLLNGTARPLADGGWQAGAAYDPVENLIFLTRPPSGNLLAFNGSNGNSQSFFAAGAYPVGLAYDPVNGLVYVGSGQIGLGAGIIWSNVSVVNPATLHVIKTVIAGGWVDSIGIDSTNGNVYAVNAYSSNVTVISGVTNKVLTTIALPSNSFPNGAAFDPVHHQMFVGLATQQHVAVIDTVAMTLLGTFPVGVQPFVLQYVPEGPYLAIGNQLSGTISFVPLAPAHYNVTFVASGLPPNAPFSVTFNGVRLTGLPSGITFRASNGSWPYSAAPVAGYSGPTPGNASVDVAGAPISITEIYVYVPPSYPVLFDEQGLPPHTNWSIAIGSVSHSATTPSISFSLPNGTYAYRAGSVPGFRPSVVSGNVTVSGGANVTTLNFSAVTYPVSFVESGLGASTTWSVVVGAESRSSQSTTVSFTEHNGTFAFVVVPVPGYTASPANGNLVVNGSSVTEPIAFAQNATGAVAVHPIVGLAPYLFVLVIGGVVALLAGLGAYGVAARRSRPRAPVPPASSEEPASDPAEGDEPS